MGTFFDFLSGLLSGNSNETTISPHIHNKTEVHIDKFGNVIKPEEKEKRTSNKRTNKAYDGRSIILSARLYAIGNKGEFTPDENNTFQVVVYMNIMSVGLT